MSVLIHHTFRPICYIPRFKYKIDEERDSDFVPSILGNPIHKYIIFETTLSYMELPTPALSQPTVLQVAELLHIIIGLPVSKVGLPHQCWADVGLPMSLLGLLC